VVRLGDAGTILLDEYQMVTAFLGIWITFAAVSSLLLLWLVYFFVMSLVIRWSNVASREEWEMTGWQTFEHKKVHGLWLGAVAYTLDAVCDGLDMINMLLLSVFAVAVDVEQFRTSSAILLTLVVVVVFSQIPRRYGDGTAAVPYHDENVLFIVIHRKRFWLIRSSLLVIQLIQLLFASIPFGCEVLGQGAGFHCKPFDERVGLTTVAYVLSMVLLQVLMRIMAIIVWMSIVLTSDDAAYVIWFTTRHAQSEPLRLYSQATQRMWLPTNLAYNARHLYKMEPYQGLVYREAGLFAARVVPPVKIRRRGRQEQCLWEGVQGWKVNQEDPGGWQKVSWLHIYARQQTLSVIHQLASKPGIVFSILFCASPLFGKDRCL
jgi:hypothetical protein